MIISDSRLVPKRPRARVGLSVTTWSECPRLRTIVSTCRRSLGTSANAIAESTSTTTSSTTIRSRLSGPDSSMRSGRLCASSTATSTTSTLATDAANESSAGRGDRDGRSLAVPAEERRVERDPAERGRDREADGLDARTAGAPAGPAGAGSSPSTSRSRRRRRTCTGRPRTRSRPTQAALLHVDQTVSQSRSSERAEQDVRREQDEPGLQQVPPLDPHDLGRRRWLGAGAVGDRRTQATATVALVSLLLRSDRGSAARWR